MLWGLWRCVRSNVSRYYWFLPDHRVNNISWSQRTVQDDEANRLYVYIKFVFIKFARKRTDT